MKNGRWQARDPKEEFFSSYMYCGNNPMGFVDPDGQTITITLGTDKTILDIKYTEGNHNVYLITPEDKKIETFEDAELDLQNYFMTDMKSGNYEPYKEIKFAGGGFDYVKNQSFYKLNKSGFVEKYSSFPSRSGQHGAYDLKGNAYKYGKEYKNKSMYVIGFLDGKLMSTRDAGNQIWGEITASLKIPLSVAKWGAGANNIGKKPGRGGLTTIIIGGIPAFFWPEIPGTTSKGEDWESATMAEHGYTNH